MGKTDENLKAAFAGESMANRMYTAFARKADEEGYTEIAELFRSTAEGETAHALGHFRMMSGVGSTRDNLLAAIAGETEEYTNMYPEFARIARDEGRNDVAVWFEALGRAEKAHADRFKKALDNLG